MVEMIIGFLGYCSRYFFFHSTIIFLQLNGNLCLISICGMRHRYKFLVSLVANEHIVVYVLSKELG